MISNNNNGEKTPLELPMNEDGDDETKLVVAEEISPRVLSPSAIGSEKGQLMFRPQPKSWVL